MKKWSAIILLLFPCIIQGQVITTFAGNGIAANTGDNGSAVSAEIDYPTGGVFDKFGNYYFTLGTHGNCVRKIAPSGIITTVAGTGIAGYSGENGPAVDAQLNNTQTVAVDTAGNLYIGDVFNNRIRKVNITTGIITTFAGTGIGAFNGDGMLATATNIQPNNLCFDNSGNLYFNDVANVRIRKINASGIVTTIAGNGASGFGGNGVSATSVPIACVGICFDNLNNLFFADDYGRIYKITPTGTISYYAGTGIPGYGGDNGIATEATTTPTYVAMDKFNNLFIAEQGQARIRLVNNSGIITTIAGNGVHGYSGDNGPASAAQINYPGGLTLDSCGNLYIADSHDWRIRKITYPKCNYLAVKDIPAQQDLSIYPNPAYNTLNISAKEINKISVSNILGQTIFTKQYNSIPKAEIDVSALPSGMYFVKVNDDMVQKFVKE